MDCLYFQDSEADVTLWTNRASRQGQAGLAVSHNGPASMPPAHHVSKSLYELQRDFARLMSLGEGAPEVCGRPSSGQAAGPGGVRASVTETGPVRVRACELRDACSLDSLLSQPVGASLERSW